MVKISKFQLSCTYISMSISIDSISLSNSFNGQTEDLGNGLSRDVEGLLVDESQEVSNAEGADGHSSVLLNDLGDQLVLEDIEGEGVVGRDEFLWDDRLVTDNVSLVSPGSADGVAVSVGVVAIPLWAGNHGEGKSEESDESEHSDRRGSGGQVWTKRTKVKV